MALANLKQTIGNKAHLQVANIECVAPNICVA